MPAPWYRSGVLKKTRPEPWPWAEAWTMRISPRFAVRVFQVDYLHTSFV